uniref:Uncharacterized protein n=1 Tax=Cucumis melo TaxID=3656 RepID=A0A9I9E5V2_CUCME
MISRITIISIWLQRSLKKTILTRADLGLPDAYINGDFSFVDKDEDLLIFFLFTVWNIEFGFVMFLHFTKYLLNSIVYEMSWNNTPHTEVHHVNNNYPYNTVGSFLEYFEGLSYDHFERLRLAQAVTAMVQQAMQYIDETPDIETKIGYNYSRIKRAQLIKKLRWLKETTGVKILRSLVKRRLIQGAHIANSS